jgi:UDP-glucose 4-epimerase
MQPSDRKQGCWLVTGGAGYIGAHMARALHDSGCPAVVLDDLSTGIRDRVGGPFVLGSVLDGALVRDVLRDRQVLGVLHFAAKKDIAESVRDPLRYYRENVEGLRVLLDSMRAVGVGRMVFASSCAVYGETNGAEVDEAAPCIPINPYGETKLTGERMLRDAARAYGLRYVALRFFNTAGAGAASLGDPGRTSIVPRVISALQSGERPQIFGDDYDTPDGTCIRDYIDVRDVALAHLAAMGLLDRDCAQVFNIGCGRGYSVREVIDEISTAAGTNVDPMVCARRTGDPARVVADVGFIRERIGWRAEHDLADMATSAWSARSS